MYALRIYQKLRPKVNGNQQYFENVHKCENFLFSHGNLIKNLSNLDGFLKVLLNLKDIIKLGANIWAFGLKINQLRFEISEEIFEFTKENFN